MTREEIIEQVNSMLAEEFHPRCQPEGDPSAGQHQLGRPDCTGTDDLQDYDSCSRPEADSDLQRPVRLH